MAREGWLKAGAMRDEHGGCIRAGDTCARVYHRRAMHLTLADPPWDTMHVCTMARMIARSLRTQRREERRKKEKGRGKKKTRERSEQ